MEIRLNNKICLIIGGSRGIGYAVAKNLYLSGARVIIAGKNSKNAKNAALSLDPKLKKIDYVKVDVSKDKDITKMASEVLTKYKKIDILICSAGIFEPFGEFSTIPFASHEKTIKTNLIGIMKCCHSLIPQMKKRKKGKIILFSGAGIGGDTPLENASSYFVSKGALVLFAEVLAAELKKYNIQINAISPGRILTDLTKATFNMSKKKLGKILSEATDDLKNKGGQQMSSVVNLITFLCSEKSNHLSGKLLSARWDGLDRLGKLTKPWTYTLRRIEEDFYIRKNE